MNRFSITKSHLLMSACLGILAVVFTILIVEQSREIGRVATFPTYDDCTYLYTAETYRHAFATQGVLITIQEIAERGLHSPVSVAAAFVAPMIFQGSAASVYYANAVVILLLLAGGVSILRPLGWLPSLAICLALLTIPYATFAVAEFRPDFLWGIGLGFLTIWTVSDRRFSLSTWNGIAFGLVFSLVLLTKPTTFASTILLSSAALFLRLARESWFNRREVTVCGVVSFLAAAFISILILTGWYALLFGSSVIRYFIDNAFGVNREVWSLEGGFLDQAGYYLWGWGGSNMFSPSMVVGVGLAILGAASCLLGRDSEARMLILSTWSLVGLAFTINAAASMKSVYLGAAFYGCLLFASLASIREWTREGGRLRGIWVSIAASLTFLIGVLTFQWPAQAYFHPGLSEFRNAVHQNLFEKLDRLSAPEKVYFLRLGPVPPENIGIYYLSRGVTIEVLSSPLFEPSSLENFLEQSQSADLVVIAEDDIVGHLSHTPLGELYAEIDTYLADSPDYHLLFEHFDYAGERFAVFARNSFAGEFAPSAQ